MMKHEVYVLSGTLGGDRPQINYMTDERNKSRDDGRFVDILDGKRDLSDYVPFELFVETGDALEWDYYVHPGTLGLYSERAMLLLRPYAMKHFRFMEGSLNDTPYFVPMRKAPLDCFDRENSDFSTYRHDPSRIMRITNFKFREELLDDPLVFCIPEDRGRVFVTESIPAFIDRACLKGFISKKVAG